MSLHKDLKQKRREQREQRERRRAAKEEEVLRLQQLQEEKERKLQELELLQEAQRQAERLLQEEEERRRSQHRELQQALEGQLREAEQVGQHSAGGGGLRGVVRSGLGAEHWGRGLGRSLGRGRSHALRNASGGGTCLEGFWEQSLWARRMGMGRGLCQKQGLWDKEPGRGMA